MSLVAQRNILVDKDGTLRIAGLGNAYILPHSTAFEAECGVGTGGLPRGRIELAWSEMTSNVTDSTQPTKANDMYSFGVMAFEVRTNSFEWYLHALLTQDRSSRDIPPPLNRIAATYSMLKRPRPTQPNHCEISGRLWCIVKRCWHIVPRSAFQLGG